MRLKVVVKGLNEGLAEFVAAAFLAPLGVAGLPWLPRAEVAVLFLC